MNVFCSLVQSGAEAKNDTGAKERINKVAAEGGALFFKGNGSEGGLMAPFLILDQKNRLIVTTTVMIDVHGTVREALKAITDAANSQRRPLRRDGENLQALRVVRSPRRWAQDWARQQRRDDNGEEKHGEDDAPRGVDIFTMDRRLPHADTCALLSIGGVNGWTEGFGPGDDDDTDTRGVGNNYGGSMYAGANLGARFSMVFPDAVHHALRLCCEESLRLDDASIVRLRGQHKFALRCTDGNATITVSALSPVLILLSLLEYELCIVGFSQTLLSLSLSFTLNTDIYLFPRR